MLQTRNAKRASAAENSELMEKHLLPRVMYSRNFFFPLRKTLVIYLFYSIWASSWEKAVLEEMGFVPRESVVGASGLRTPTRWSAAAEPDAGSSQGCRQALPAAPLLTQHSLCLHSLHMGTSVFFLLQAFSSAKPPQVTSSDIKGVYQVWETSLLILPE